MELGLAMAVFGGLSALGYDALLRQRDADDRDDRYGRYDGSSPRDAPLSRMFRIGRAFGVVLTVVGVTVFVGSVGAWIIDRF